MNVPIIISIIINAIQDCSVIYKDFQCCLYSHYTLTNTISP